MISAKIELENVLKNYGKKLKAAAIEKIESHWETDGKFYLYSDYTEQECKDFMESIDFEYDDGFGAEYLVGILWFTDNTYAVPQFYDG